MGPFFHATKKTFIYFSGKLDFFRIAVDRNFLTRMLTAIIHFYARDNDGSANVLVCILPLPPPFACSHKLALSGVKIATTKMSFAFARLFKRHLKEKIFI